MITRTHSRPTISRRGFLGWTWVASLAGLFGQAGAALLQYFTPRVEPGTFGNTVVVGSPDEFEPGTVTYIRQGRFYISRLEDGGLLALWQRCPHLGCKVAAREDDGQFYCPCHDSSFTRRGEVINGPALRPLDLFPISLQDGKLVVDTSRRIERSAFEAAQAFFPEPEA
jgi:cytochrome b6-f complex iron-sulfur subunit